MIMATVVRARTFNSRTNKVYSKAGSCSWTVAHSSGRPATLRHENPVFTPRGYWNTDCMFGCANGDRERLVRLLPRSPCLRQELGVSPSDSARVFRGASIRGWKTENRP
jgi:hypothetical protein